MQQRPTSPVLVRRRSADIYYRGEMVKSPPRAGRRPASARRLPHAEPDMLAHGVGSEWVASREKNAFVRWYKGGWRDNRLHGVGTILSEDSGHIVFRGRFDHGKRVGYGREFSEDRRRKVLYRGEFAQGKKTGVGAYYYEDVDGGPSDGRMKFEGELRNGRFHGHGVLYFRPTELRAARCAQYRGSFKNGLKHGYGTEFAKSGEVVYAGGWRLGFRHGDGIVYHQNWNGRLCFIGRFEIGSQAKLIAKNTMDENKGAAVPHGGFGQLFFRDGRRYVGRFCQGGDGSTIQRNHVLPA